MIYNNSQIRRQDRTLDEDSAAKLLKEGEYGVLSMQAEDGNGAYGIPLTMYGMAAILFTSIALRQDES